jgi:sugar lactone lactonase YvrE
MKTTYTLLALLAAFEAAALAQSQVPQFTISTVAGNGITGFSGDGGPATSAALSTPFGLAVDAAGNLYIADFVNQRIRKVSTNGTIATIVGTGVAGFSGDGGPATAAQINRPSNVSLDAAGNLYIADSGNNRIRKVTPGGTISTVAGNGNAAETGDGGPATSASLKYPEHAFVDSAGNLLIADGDGCTIRKVAPNGIIATIAGNRNAGYSGDGGTATSASLNNPTSVVEDPLGNIYIGDSNNNRIRKVTPGGTISTVAGTGVRGYAGDGGAATAAQLAGPSAKLIDAAGNLYIGDTLNNRVRILFADGTIGTVAGNGTAGSSGDGGPATGAKLNFPNTIAAGHSGALYVADAFNQRIRLLTPVPAAVAAPTNVLPQFAFGGGWYSALYFTNLGSTAVSFPLNFLGDDGNPLTVPSLGSSSATVTLAPRGTATIAAPNTGTLVEGYVTAALPAGVIGYGVVRQSVPGIADQEAVVPLSGVTATTSTLLFDETNYITGVAVVNLASANATITINAHDAQGNPLGSGTISLGGNAKTEAALRNIPGLAGIAGNVGSVDFTVTTGTLAVLGLRFDGSAFTSIPTSDK